MRSYFVNSRFGVNGFEVVGEPPARRGEEPIADYRIVTPGLFATLDIALRDGRLFTDADTLDKPPVALINQVLARRHFHGRNPVGRRLSTAGQELEIAGVVEDVNLYGLDTKIEPAVYVPHAQHPNEVMSILVHSAQPPASLAAAIRREVMALDREQPIAEVRTMAEVASDSLMLRRIPAILLGVFALLALALSTVGIYGLTAYSVNQQLQEIGIRVALGAQRGDVLRLVVGRGMGLALAGTALGMAGALAASRLLGGLLFGITNTDATVMAGVPVCLLAVSAVACYLPARRATRIDPISALRVS
jgi:putative ABC transport system permease protein